MPLKLPNLCLSVTNELYLVNAAMIECSNVRSQTFYAFNKPHPVEMGIDKTHLTYWRTMASHRIAFHNLVAPEGIEPSFMH
jgi:hypothetical protein